MKKPIIYSLSEKIIEIAFSGEFSENEYLQLFQAKKYLEKINAPFISEMVLTYQVLSIFMKEEYSWNHEKAHAFLEELPWKTFQEKGGQKTRNMVIPVSYGHEDLEYLEGLLQLSSQQIIEIHSKKTYRVFMIGFLPGFAYCGFLDPSIQVPRKTKPTMVAKGGVAIAADQTGIYPLDSPGGWHVIGKTDITLFDWDRKTPSYLLPGDQVQFVPK